jgi:hypothetical protein
VLLHWAISVFFTSDRTRNINNSFLGQSPKSDKIITDFKRQKITTPPLIRFSGARL